VSGRGRERLIQLERSPIVSRRLGRNFNDEERLCRKMGEMLMETEFNTLWSIKACYFICTITLVQISTNFSNSFTATVSNELQKSSSKIPPRLKSVANYLAKIDFNSVTLKRVIQCTCAAKSFISSILT